VGQFHPYDFRFSHVSQSLPGSRLQIVLVFFIPVIPLVLWRVDGARFHLGRRTTVSNKTSS